MSVLKSIDADTATGKSREILDQIGERVKTIPNMVKILANSPAMTRLYLQFNEAFKEARMTSRLRVLISAAISEFHGCDYTLSTAMAFGPREGVTEAELTAARRADASDPQTAAALQFAVAVAKERGRISAEQTDKLRNAGFTDEEIVEIIGAVILNTFRNYVNLVAQTEIDFPPVRTGKAA